MESDTSETKKTSLEEMSKEDVIKKYNNLLMIAKKAKQAKNGISDNKFDQVLLPISLQITVKETLEELKKSKENESKLNAEINTLKEFIESFTEKQKNFAELENRVKQSEEKATNLKNSLEKLENQHASKIVDCNVLEETLKKMSEKLGKLEEKHSEALEKLEDFKENYAKLDIEKKLCEEKLLAYEREQKTAVRDDKVVEELKEKEVEVEKLKKKCEELEEKYKNIPENRADVVNENKKLQKFLSDAEKSKEKLTEELNYFRKSLSEFDDKSKDYAKLSEMLMLEEKENLKLMEDIGELNSKCDQLQKNHEQELINLENKLQKENDVLNKQFNELNTSYQQILNEKEEKNSEIRELQLQLEENMAQQKIVEEDKSKLEEKLSKLSAEFEKTLQNEKIKHETSEKELTELRKELNDLNLRLSKAEEGKSVEKFVDFCEDCVKVRKKLDEVLKCFGLLKELKRNFENDLKCKLKEFQEDQNIIRQKTEEVIVKYVAQLHNGNSELLSEMNVMNQALKERGETISKLEQLVENQRKELDEASTKITNQSSKLQEKNKKLEELEEEITKGKQEVETKHKAMREMEEEMWKMKNNDCQNETLSSSTLSKADDAARLMELEESFEERYTKLKMIAVKLKKKVAELQKQVEVERDKLITAETDYQNKVAGFHSQIKSLRNIQTEYDALQDVLDEERKEKNAIKKSLEAAQQELISYKHELEDVKSDREKHKTDKTSFDKIKKEFSAHIGELKQTIDKQRTELGQFEKQIEEMKNQLNVKDRHIEEEREKHKMAMQLLEEQKQDSKKHSVLELEMAAYEKTAEELKKKLDNKSKEMKDLENTLELQRKTLESKEDEINNLKSTISDVQLKADTFNDQIKQLSEDLNGQRLELDKKAEIVKALEKIVEEKNQRVENLSLELEEITKEKFKSEEKFRNAEEKLCRQIHSLEEKLSTVQDVLSQREMELDELKQEYQAYKIRAQSVLRQSQKEINPSKQQNVLEELEEVKSTSESLKLRLEESGKKLEKLSEENKTLLDEKKRLFGRVQELNNVVCELRDENQVLKKTKQKENEEHAEALKMQKLQSDTLVQCFKKQIEDLEVKHANELEELKKEQERSQKHNPVFILPEIKRNDGRDLPEKRKFSTGFIPVKPEREVLDVMLLEREECEGSESVDSTSPQTGHNNLIPLDQLLNNPEHSEVSRKSSFDANHLRELLDKSENRIKHLTILLAEAESDSARINQLNEVLKEEIRRLQRSLEREKHAQNLEYLKNVIMKFVSLQNIDEKLRLVPVLNTILKLSPEEEQILTNCAKGVFENGGKGWGNYLNIWPMG